MRMAKALRWQCHKDGYQQWLSTIAIDNGYQGQHEDSEGVYVKWSTAQGWRWRMDGDGARTAMVWGWLSTTTIGDGQSTTAINDGR
jgi:hypothetical protein